MPKTSSIDSVVSIQYWLVTDGQTRDDDIYNIFFCSSYDVCSCFVIAVIVLYCAFVRHGRGHSEAVCYLFQ